MATIDQPHPGADRIRVLDGLRGVALLGIFAINILGFGLGFWSPLDAGGSGALNYGLWTLVEVAIEGTMRGLFSLMFGVSVLLFMAAAPTPESPILRADLYYRRTLWLLVLGLLHAFVLLGPGDILFIYALAGLVLFPFRVLGIRTLVSIAMAILTLLTALAFFEERAETDLGNRATEAAQALSANQPISDGERVHLEEWQALLAENRATPEDLQQERDDRASSIGRLYRSNAGVWVAIASGTSVPEGVLDALMMMLLGMALFKAKIVTGDRSTRFYVGWTMAFYLIGLGLRTYFVAQRWGADFSPILWASPTFSQVTRVATTLGHVGLFILAWRLMSESRLFKALAAVGRTALTNYLAQTVVANLVFSAVGLSLYGTLERTQIYAVMATVWLAQLVASWWWLRHFRFGPVEWIWRCATYWEPIRIRR